MSTASLIRKCLQRVGSMSVTSCAHCVEKCVDHITEVPSISDGEVEILSGAYIQSIDYEDERRWHIAETFVNEKFM
jgi:hypothetical protein